MLVSGNEVTVMVGGGWELSRRFNYVDYARKCEMNYLRLGGGRGEIRTKEKYDKIKCIASARVKCKSSTVAICYIIID